MLKKQPALPRPPLTTEELEKLTANDRLRIKLTDKENLRPREINRARDKERSERSARLRIEEEPILEDLRQINWNVESVWDVDNKGARYPGVIPILLKHLVLPYSDRIRAGIARALTVPAAREGWPIFVEEYRKALLGWGIIALGDTKEYRLGAKDGLACAWDRVQK